MDSDGYIATTLPYDHGFDMYIDGEKVDIKKIENLYIGTPIASGEHHVLIKYSIPGFKLGLILTIGAYVLIAITFKYDLKKIRRDKN